MTIREQLSEIESALSFRYPPSFVSMVEEFAAIVASEDFQRIFPATRLILTYSQVAEEREMIPISLLPFMLEEQTTWNDIFAFDTDGECDEFRVVVWADHAIVETWDSFPVFFQWIREQMALS